MNTGDSIPFLPTIGMVENMLGTGPVLDTLHTYHYDASRLSWLGRQAWFGYKLDVCFLTDFHYWTLHSRTGFWRKLRAHGDIGIEA